MVEPKASNKVDPKASNMVEPAAPDKTRGASRPIWLLLAFLGLTLSMTLTYLYYRDMDRPSLVPGNILVLTLFNVNLILVTLLVLLLSRNLVKLYFERRHRLLGSGFRTKLIAAFVGLSLIPSVLLFIVATGYLTNSVENWFSIQVEESLKSSLEVAQTYYQNTQEEAAQAARQLAREAAASGLLGEDRPKITVWLASSLSRYRLDGVELRNEKGTLARTDGPSLSGQRPFELPPDILARARAGDDGVVTGAIAAGDLIRAIAPVMRGGTRETGGGKVVGFVAVDRLVPHGLVMKMEKITRAFEEYKQLQTFKNPIKGSYLLLFFLMTLVILFAATWFGFYLARGITVPIQKLAAATQAVARGNAGIRIDVRATDEIGVLVEAFNRMSHDLKVGQEQVEAFHRTLRESNIELDRRRAYIETVLESVGTGVISIDARGRIGTCNRAAEKMLQLEHGSIVGKPALDALRHAGLEPLASCLVEPKASTPNEAALSGGDISPREVEIPVQAKRLTLRVRVTPLRDEGGAAAGAVVVFDDLSELIRAQKAAAWQEVAQRIAHEIKNPLTPIQLSAQRLKKKYQEPSGDFGAVLGEATDTIINEVAGMKKMVDEFSSFARLPASRPQPHDLHEILSDVIRLYQSAHRHLELISDFDERLPTLHVDRDQIKRVFVNLFENAVEAMNQRGRLWVSTRYDAAGRKVRVEVADDGVGIRPEDRDKLFLPYFSRKRKGTGLGLAIVDRIISDHNGQIRVAENLPRGTRFLIELPA